MRLSSGRDLARRGAEAGAWLPAGYDAGAELRALIAAIDQRLERRVLRVGLHVDTWDNIPRRIAAPGRQVKVGWFRTIDPHVINLITLGIEHINRSSSTSRLSGPHVLHADETTTRSAAGGGGCMWPAPPPGWRSALISTRYASTALNALDASAAPSPATSGYPQSPWPNDQQASHNVTKLMNAYSPAPSRAFMASYGSF